MPIVNAPQAAHPRSILRIDPAQIGHKVSEHTDPYSHLSAFVDIGGTGLNLDAIEVMDLDGEQVGADGAEETFLDLQMFSASDGEQMSTIEIEGRTYALVMTPMWVRPEPAPHAKNVFSIFRRA